MRAGQSGLLGTRNMTFWVGMGGERKVGVKALGSNDNKEVPRATFEIAVALFRALVFWNLRAAFLGTWST